LNQNKTQKTLMFTINL